MHPRMAVWARRMFRYRVLAAALACCAGPPPTAGGEAPPAKTAVTCTNPSSGASWRLAIDFASSTVDANPAAITPAAISWFDPKDGGRYTLDRKTGELTASVASSTGGYFRHGRCALAGPR